MKAVRHEEFARWAAGHGIGVDPRYPDSGCLTLLPPTKHARFWVVPGDLAAFPHFVASLLSGHQVLDTQASVWSAGRCMTVSSPLQGAFPRQRV